MPDTSTALERLLLVTNAGQVDDDRLALHPDVGLGDALSLEFGADQITDDREFLRRRRLGRREDDRHAALEVEPEDRGVVGGDVVAERDQHDQHDTDQGGPEATLS